MQMILISFDIDGTLEEGDPPGILTIDFVREAKKDGYLVGSCSDRPISAQRAMWARHGIEVDFAVSKHMLPEVKSRFTADVYYHIGDREDLDKRPAEQAGFEFLWPDEALAKPWARTSVRR
ncbi:MAG: HAD family hydrolase [Gammaproteobacteria bacterium]|nr:HAD family hydrolase [Gammaproteobacteria bacterium]MXY57431.1 HAD family hydrolase [Gammaproteobacteria bacterium]MYK47294.1 HAD family hydrolase [Gammaproteobacteria bacterium]